MTDLYAQPAAEIALRQTLASRQESAETPSPVASEPEEPSRAA